MQNTYETFAAVAVFRELYDKGNDIYDVLGLYIKEVILSEKMPDFTCAEITDRLNSINSFKINEAVVKVALKRLGIGRVKGKYHVECDFNVETGQDIYAIQMQQSQALLDNLIGYIEEEEKVVLSTEEREEVKQQFFKYMINQDTIEKYSLLISTYIYESAD